MWMNLSDAATDFIKELNADPKKYPDRVVGIVLSAMLDERLADTIKNRVQYNDKLIENTFGHESNLFGNFGTRSILGFFLTLYSYDTYRDLTLIGKIRNAFAHKIEVHNFDDPPVRDWIDELKITSAVLNINNLTNVWNYDPQNLAPITNRTERYIRAIHALNLALYLENENPGPGLKPAPRF
jgi:hypothetical protein